MHVRIVAKPFSLSGKKTIYLDGAAAHYAVTDEVAGQECIKLVDKNDVVFSLIIRELGLLTDSYTVRFLNRDNIPISFKRTKQWKQNYEGAYNTNTYTIKENKFNVYTVTENGNEIVRWLKTHKLFSGNEDNFEIADDFKDLHMALSLCLIIHQKESDKRGPD